MEPGKQPSVGGYVCERELGRGGQGVVWLARDRMGRQVVVKFLLAGEGYDEVALARVRQEFGAASRVGELASARVLDADLTGRHPYIVSEFVPGPTIRQHVAANGPLPPGRLHSLALAVAHALAQVHRVSVVHRDIKPSNILLSPDGPRIIDFGIARDDRLLESALTTQDSELGSPVYMSPEQVKSLRVSGASDVFSLGGTLYFAATGRHPFEGESGYEVLVAVCERDADLAAVPEPVRSVIAGCLRKDPAERPTAAQLVTWLAGAETSTQAEGSAYRPLLQHQGHRRPNAAAGPAPRSAHQPPTTAASIGPPLGVPEASAEAIARVRQLARGERKDYACERLPFAEGGQADVFRAIHKPTRTIVALKQLRNKNPAGRQTARMKREIDAGRRLGDHPHAMPVLDADPKNRWFVMPYAQTTAEQCQQELAQPAALKSLLDALCSVLAEAHQEGWVHRDIKPANILRLDGKWVLADWGIVRRPRGQTTDAQRTRVGVPFGTDGFAAPELSQNANAAKATADIYSLGQLIGWALTGSMPQINVPLMPRTGPWRTVIRAATQSDPARRPAAIKNFQQLIQQETEIPTQPAIVRGAELQRALDAGSAAAAHELITLAAASTDDEPFYCDFLVTLPPGNLIPALLAAPDKGVDIVRAMATLLGTYHSPERGKVDATIMWLTAIARKAADASELDLLEECCNGAFEWVASWGQGTPKTHISRWLPTLTGDSASSVAIMLRQHPACAAHFRHLTTNLHVDHRIRAAIDSAPSEGHDEPLDSRGRPETGVGADFLRQIMTVAGKRTILLFDIAHFGDRDAVESAYLRRALYDITDRVLAAAGIDEGQRQRTDRGDSVIEIMDPSVSVIALLRVLLSETPEQLRAINRMASSSVQLKLRGVLATGQVVGDNHNGWEGSDLNHACRLLEAKPMRDALRDSFHNFVLGIPEHMYEGIVRRKQPGVPPESFERVMFNTKEGKATAWLTTPA